MVLSVREKALMRISENFEELVDELMLYIESTVDILTKQDAIEKFYEGEVEHGDDLDYLDSEKEMVDELLDLICYLAIRDAQKGL